MSSPRGRGAREFCLFSKTQPIFRCLGLDQNPHPTLVKFKANGQIFNIPSQNPHPYFDWLGQNLPPAPSFPMRLDIDRCIINKGYTNHVQ